jgi:hypothetical protein
MYADGAALRGARASVVRERRGLIVIALFPTVHLLRDRHGLLMNTYGRERLTLNNEPGL